jgi:hypothetical protein
LSYLQEIITQAAYIYCANSIASLAAGTVDIRGVTEQRENFSSVALHRIPNVSVEHGTQAISISVKGLACSANEKGIPIPPDASRENSSQ